MNDSPRIKKELADWHGVDPEQVLLGNGSNQLLMTFLSATVDGAEKLLFCPPVFSLFESMSVIHQANLIKVYHSPEKSFPLEDVEEKILSEKPRVCIFCSPSNPTGYEMSLDIIEKLCTITSGLILLDEAYAEFSDQTAIHLIRKYPNLVISRTFSKAFCLAGLRFGYILGQKQVIEQLSKVNIPFNVNLFTELVVTRLLVNRSFMQENVSFLKMERERIFTEMLKIKSVHVYPSAANFLLFKVKEGKKVFEKLKARDVLVRDVGSYPLLQDHLRVNVGTEKENELFLKYLKESVL